MTNRIDRRDAIRLAGAGAAAAILGAQNLRPAGAFPRPEKNAISLACWSLVRSFRAGYWKQTDLARLIRNDLGLDGIEYVNQFFENPVSTYLNQLNKAAADHGVENVLIMVDHEGSMVAKDKKDRMQSAINHRKWVDVAAYLGCHAIRCNAHGGGNSMADDPDAVNRAAESFGDLLDYAKPAKINVIIENHGGLSSDPAFLPALCRKLDNPNFGLLPDYGNYPQGISQADREDAVRKAMPFAKGVSVKAGWQPDGTHPAYDLEPLIRISMKAGYRGFWGIESGMRADAPEGASPEEIWERDKQAVLWTKAAIEKAVFGK